MKGVEIAWILIEIINIMEYMDSHDNTYRRIDLSNDVKKTVADD